MGLPRYIVNLEDMLEGFTLNPKNKVEVDEEKWKRGYQRSKGLTIEFRTVDELEELSTSESVGSAIWQPPTDILITGIKIGVSDNFYSEISHECDWFRDSVDLYINNELIFESIHIKDISQYKSFRCKAEALENDIIKFIYHNTSGTNKSVWFDIDYLADPLLCNVVVRCIDENGIELQSETMEYSLGEHIFLAPSIDEYVLIDERYHKKITIVKNDINTEKEIIFNYISKASF